MLVVDEGMVRSGYGDSIAPARVGEVLGVANGHHPGEQGERPGLITVEATSPLADAIELMQRYSISQLPVRASAETGAVALVGSLQERTLLDRIYRDPGIVGKAVAAAMDPPFGTMAADTPLEVAFEMLLRGDTALVVLEAETPIGLVPRADLLEFVAHPRG